MASSHEMAGALLQPKEQMLFSQRTQARGAHGRTWFVIGNACSFLKATRIKWLERHPCRAQVVWAGSPCNRAADRKPTKALKKYSGALPLRGFGFF